MRSRIKICYVISSLTKQGPVQVLLDLIRFIEFKDYDVTILTLKTVNENSLFNEFKLYPIKIYQIDKVHRYNFFKLFRIVNNYIVKNNIEILHSHCLRSQIIGFLLKNKIIHITTVHSIPGLQELAQYGKIFGIISSLLTKLIIKKTPFSIACSNSMVKSLKINNFNSMHCIVNGITPTSYSVKGKDNLKNKLNILSGFNYFISVGRFSEEKNLKIIIEIFQKLNINKNKLLLLGNGLLYNDLYQLKNENILLPGFKFNVIDYLLASNYYISASISEGMPISVLEAMSVGLPIILSDIPAHREIFEYAEGKNIGHLFNLNSTEELSFAIQEIIKEDYVKLQKNVLEVFRSHFTSKRMSKEYQDYYKQIRKLK